jgi:membrane associated rhomboid family serine protease
VDSPIRLPSSHDDDDGAPRRREPPLDPTSWSGALIVMAGLVVVLWAIQIANAADNYGLDRTFGLRPRHWAGLWGVVGMPFLHAGYHHLWSNTIPLLGVGWVLLLSGLRNWFAVTGIVVIGGGVLTWLVAPGDELIVGASGMIFGWMGYLLARAFFSRQLKWILVAVLVLMFFGTLLLGLLPSLNSDVSWQAHICGFAAGIGAGALLHPRGGEPRSPRRSAVS